MPMSLERRAVAELRVEGRTLAGHAALFNVEARIGRTIETIRPGAFSQSLKSAADVRAFVDHDSGKLLGRTRSRTLQLEEDARGLAFSIDVPATSLGEDILELGRRGDLSGMSFGFRATDEHWSGRRRELRAVDLVEISVITGGQPAYPDTTVAVRYRADALRQLNEAIGLAAASLRPRRDGAGYPGDGRYARYRRS
jgi:uncharacterized protein